VSRSPLPIPAANKLVMHNSDQITFQLPYLQDQQLLTLHLHSSQCTVHSQSDAIDGWIQNQLNIFVDILPDGNSAHCQS
jgi:hypothetical protein